MLNFLRFDFLLYFLMKFGLKVIFWKKVELLCNCINVILFLFDLLVI